MTGRNQPCPCGSGKKFKKCHGGPGQDLPTANRPVDADQLLGQARIQLQLHQFEAAWSTSLSIPLSVDSCRLQVDILIARCKADDLDKALAIIEQWKKLDARDPVPWSRTLEIAIRREDFATANLAFTKLSKVAPGHATTYYYKGLLAQLQGNLKLALASYFETARLQHPDYSEPSWPVLAANRAIDTTIGKFPGSSSSELTKVLGEPDVVASLKSSLENWEKHYPSIADSLSGEEKSSISSAWYQLAAACTQGMIDSKLSQSCHIKALQLNPDNQTARTSYLFSLNYDSNITPEEIYVQHLSAGDWWASKFPETSRKFFNVPNVDRPLRIAYLSSDFRNHPVAYFILPVLQHHAVGSVRSYLYYTHSKRDDYTQLIADASFQFDHVWDFDDQALASKIERDGIDILVDLNGHSAEGRTSLLARRVAPVQISWLGYPNTTGLATVDYRIGDLTTDPDPEGQLLCREKLIRLPRLFSVYNPIMPPPSVAPGPYTKLKYVTFGSFNNIKKINAGVISCWSEILKQVPDSRLLIKCPSMNFPSLQNELLQSFEEKGIDSGRIEFQGLVHGHKNHLEAFSRIDIHLDSFPYHGTTTTCESLLMGVPVVTMQGRDHRSRVGASLLNSVGHPEWVARDDQEYCKIAAELASNPTRLEATRAGLRQELESSALMDAESFTRDLEQAYKNCWADWCRQRSPTA